MRRSGQRVLNSFVRCGAAKRHLRNGESQEDTRKIFFYEIKKNTLALYFRQVKKTNLKKIKKIEKNCSKKNILWNNLKEG